MTNEWTVLVSHNRNFKVTRVQSVIHPALLVLTNYGKHSQVFSLLFTNKSVSNWFSRQIRVGCSEIETGSHYTWNGVK